MTTPDSPDAPAPSDFIRDIVAADLASGACQRVVTRFPPEPNGYLHIGHAKSICLNFGIAKEFGGVCHLRMDDTNPAKEDVEYVDSIIADVRWLIADWADDVLRFKEDAEPFYASDYFGQLYAYALTLIHEGKAYVCDLTAEQTDEYRGAPDRPGRPSPFRDRSVEENLHLFHEMRAGAFPDGARTLRARIDPHHPNVWLRDPVLYRIRHTAHHHTGDAWCIYPMYDYAHCLSDSIERITHSVCTLEFEVHRPLYNWLLESLPVPSPRPHQHEFARLSLSYTLMSKRKLLALVSEGLVAGWDDPRMPTISGLRRRGVTAAALRHFALHIGITKYNGLTEVGVLEHAIREDLNTRAQRRLGVLRPLKVVITNLPDGHTETVPAANHPLDPALGTRAVPFSRELYIEQDDFAEVPPPKFFRLKPCGEVRLKYAYIIKCDEVVKNADGTIAELRCTADLDSKTGGATSSRKIKGTIHWVSAAHALAAEVRLYDRLFTEAEPEAEGRDFRTCLNPHSLEVLTAQLEPALVTARPEERFQLERLAYLALDPTSTPERPVFNRVITLKDTWAKEAAKS
ncbi:MAG: glutamine--tRNA ligase/YqeY domain fusion protein [Chthoniobacter sp.]|nr:glutamine--tRNA ligase/YqeY domain fusion protein [Chthoniobacter sp.]